MKEIKLFIASSIVEFGEEREKLLSLFYTLNQAYEKYGVRFQVICCENLSHAVSAGRKQEEYNQEIRDSKYVYFLIGKHMGAFTFEEFKVAVEQYKKTGEAPLVYTFFKTFTDGGQSDDSVRQFMDVLSNDMDHYYSEFSSFDKLKLDILLELIRNADVRADMRFEDGQATLNGVGVMALDNIPAYSRNDELNARRAELAELNEELARKRIAFADDPEDDDLMNELSELGSRRSRLTEEIRGMESAVLDQCSLMLESRSDRRSAREESAMRLIGEGNVREANVILKDDLWEKEMTDTETMIASLAVKFEEFIRGKRLLVSNLKASGSPKKTDREIRKAYDAACGLALKWNVGTETVREYGEYLYRQKDYPAGIAVMEKLLAGELLRADTEAKERAERRLLLGKLYYYNQQYPKAEDVLKEAVSLCGIAENGGQEERFLLARVYAELANLYWKRKQVKEQEEALERAISLLEELRETPFAETEEYIDTYGTVQNRMGLLRRR